MTRYFLKRLAGAIPTLFIIITAAFFLIRAVQMCIRDRNEGTAMPTTASDIVA